MAAPLILFAPSSGAAIGGGHVMRSGALALQLKALGADCRFAVGDLGASILQRFYPGAFEVEPQPQGDPRSLPALAQALDPAAVVLDDYAADAAAEQTLAAPGRLLMAVDDLADRPHAVDLLLDPGYGRAAADYAALAPGAQVLAGPTYALLRPGFDADTTPPAGPLRRLFLSFGLSDVEGVTACAAGLARTVLPDVALDVALAAEAPSLPSLRARAAAGEAIALHVDTPDVASLMRGADAALGAGGSSVWERCALGLPSLAVVVADNQRPLIGALQAQGVVIGCDLHASDFEACFVAGLEALRDPGRRRILAERSRALCDGRGAERAARALLARISRLS